MSMKNTNSRIVSNLSYEVIGKDSQLMKHFTGLTSLQFNVLFEFSFITLSILCSLKIFKDLISRISIFTYQSIKGAGKVGEILD